MLGSESPLWVISRHFSASQIWSAYGQKRTIIERCKVSAHAVLRRSFRPYGQRLRMRLRNPSPTSFAVQGVSSETTEVSYCNRLEDKQDREQGE